MQQDVYVKVDSKWMVESFAGYDLGHLRFHREYKTQCPKCDDNGGDNSGDNLHIYAPRNDLPSGGHCFACGFTIPSMSELLKESDVLSKKIKGDKKLSVYDVSADDYAKLKANRLTQQQIDEVIANTGDDPKFRRGMNKESSVKYGNRYSYDVDGKVTDMYTPCFIEENGEYVITGYKHRKFPKEFSAIGYVGKLNIPLGKNVALSPKTLIVVAGEIDLVTADMLLKAGLQKYQSHYRDINLITSPIGESSIVNMLRSNHEWVNKHTKIILCLDNDTAGERATQECVDLLGSENVLVAKLSFKDVNDYIAPTSKLSFYDAAHLFCKDVYWDATPTVDFGIVGSGDLFDAGLERLNQEKVKLPSFMTDLNKCFTDGEVGVGEWVNIIAGTSSGKSTVLDAWVVDWLMKSQYKVCVFTFEADDGGYGLKMASLATGKPITRISGKENRIEFYKSHKSEINQLLLKPDGSHRFVFVDKLPTTVDSLKTMMLAMVRLHGVRVIVIDPFLHLRTICKSKDEYDGLIAWIDANIRMHYNVLILAGIHTRKSLSGGKDASRGGSVSEEDASDSRALISAATINLTMSRNKEAECPIERNTIAFGLPKNRPDTITAGVAGKAFYRAKANRLYPFSYAESMDFFKDDEFLSIEELNTDDGYGMSLNHICDNIDEYEGGVSYQSEPPPIIPINEVIEGVAEV